MEEAAAAPRQARVLGQLGGCNGAGSAEWQSLPEVRSAAHLWQGATHSWVYHSTQHKWLGISADRGRATPWRSLHQMQSCSWQA